MATDEALWAWVGRFEAHAGATDQLAHGDVATPLLGLVSEVGSLVAALKKRRRDADSFFGYREAVAEELGDVLWYASALARRFGTSLKEVTDISTSTQSYSAGIWIDELGHNKILEEDPFEASLLVLAAEAGRLASQFAAGAYQRDEHALRADMARLISGLADAAAASEVALDEAAALNIEKRESRWPIDCVYPELPDEGLHVDEQLPRTLRVMIYERDIKGSKFVFQKTGGVLLGDRLTDNHMPPDDYRFHDVFHLAHAAVLGWSPTTRALLKVKRKSNSEIDENEDGARAVLIEEGLTTWIFETAKEHRFFEHTDKLGLDLLKDIKRFVRGYEAADLPMWLWESAILQGYSVFRELRKYRCGIVLIDLEKRRIWFERMTKQDRDICGLS